MLYVACRMSYSEYGPMMRELAENDGTNERT